VALRRFHAGIQEQQFESWRMKGDIQTHYGQPFWFWLVQIKIRPMKFLPSQLSCFRHHRPSRLRILNLLCFLLVLAALIATYSVIFHYIMDYEGQSHSWITGLYWTLTVMSTLGFGDITFQSDLGRLFSTLVLVSGIIFLLILLPVTFIEFFMLPGWACKPRDARQPACHPRQKGTLSSRHSTR
jgi:hypothetical protein